MIMDAAQDTDNLREFIAENPGATAISNEIQHGTRTASLIGRSTKSVIASDLRREKLHWTISKFSSLQSPLS